MMFIIDQQLAADIPRKAAEAKGLELLFHQIPAEWDAGYEIINSASRVMWERREGPWALLWFLRGR